MNRNHIRKGGEVRMARTKRDVVEYRIYDLPVDLPVFALSGEQWRISDTPSSRLHFHNCLEIGFCRSDSGYIRFEDEIVPFRAGDVFLIPRHVPHTTCSSQGCRSQWAYLFLDLDSLARTTLDAAKSVAGQSVQWPSRYLKFSAGPQTARIPFLAHCLMDEASRSAADSAQMLRIYAIAMNAELSRYFSSATQPVSKPSKLFPLKPALEYILDHYMEPCDTETLASMCHLSQTHFRRLFLACMDATPLQFVISTRIYQACILLANTNDPVLTIAQAVGMPSASSFNRNFQQVVGMSPRQYRASLDPSGDSSRHNGEVLAYKGWILPDK